VWSIAHAQVTLKPSSFLLVNTANLSYQLEPVATLNREIFRPQDKLQITWIIIEMAEFRPWKFTEQQCIWPHLYTTGQNMSNRGEKNTIIRNIFLPLKTGATAEPHRWWMERKAKSRDRFLKWKFVQKWKICHHLLTLISFLSGT